MNFASLFYVSGSLMENDYHYWTHEKLSEINHLIICIIIIVIMIIYVCVCLDLMCDCYGFDNRNMFGVIVNLLLKTC